MPKCEMIDLVQYMYEAGSLSLRDLCDLVEEGTLDEEDFHDITRMWHHALKETRKWD